MLLTLRLFKGRTGRSGAFREKIRENSLLNTVFTVRPEKKQNERWHSRQIKWSRFLLNNCRNEIDVHFLFLQTFWALRVSCSWKTGKAVFVPFLSYQKVSRSLAWSWKYVVYRFVEFESRAFCLSSVRTNVFKTNTNEQRTFEVIAHRHQVGKEAEYSTYIEAY